MNRKDNKITENWDIYPVDQKDDGKRWARLVEEIDELAKRCENFENRSSSTPTREDFPDNREVTHLNYEF